MEELIVIPDDWAQKRMLYSEITDAPLSWEKFEGNFNLPICDGSTWTQQLNVTLAVRYIDPKLFTEFSDSISLETV